MASPDERPYLSSLLPAVVVLSAPVAVLLGGLWLIGKIDLGHAVIALAAIVLWIGFFVRRHMGDLLALINYAQGLRRDRATAPPRESRFRIVSRLRLAIEGLQRENRDENARAAAAAGVADAILDSLPDPVILLDAGRRVVRANEAAARLFGGNPAGRDLALVLRHPAVLEAVEAVLSEGNPLRSTSFVLPGTVARDWVVRVVGLPRGVGVGMAALLALQDMTLVKRAEQMRADFVANASHELRTPLSTLIGFIETLQGPAKDDAEARVRFLAIMREQAERMSRLIRDLLSLSQIELNEHTVPEGAVDVLAVLHSVGDMMQFQVAGKKMRIDISTPSELPAVTGDRDQLVQVFQNLIDNAVKYGRPGTTVDVRLQELPAGSDAGRRVSVSVRDHGEGIAREHLPRLTERFYRVDHARSRELGGTGLGLAIVKHIVNRHRGQLQIESEEGEGSTFTVVLPAAPQTEQPLHREAG